MAALTEGRNTTELHVGGVHYSYSREAAATIYAGALAAQNADGKAVPASDAAGLVVLGRAETGANAGFGVVIRKGTYLYNNGEGAEALTAADIGKECFVVDQGTRRSWQLFPERAEKFAPWRVRAAWNPYLPHLKRVRA